LESSRNGQPVLDRDPAPDWRRNRGHHTDRQPGPLEPSALLDVEFEEAADPAGRVAARLAILAGESRGNVERRLAEG
jgi:hypothetical protein